MILSPDRCENILTVAKFQPFCRKYNLDIGVYNLRKCTILPESVKERNICLPFYKSHFCAIQKLNRKTSLLKPIDEMENNFKYEETQIKNDLLKQVIEYKFPISYEVNCLYSVFAFDLETCPVTVKVRNTVNHLQLVYIIPIFYMSILTET